MIIDDKFDSYLYNLEDFSLKSLCLIQLITVFSIFAIMLALYWKIVTMCVKNILLLVMGFVGS